ncbi:MAG: hypothetical protein HRU70_09110 [Phycisphaeraceae bacterium]|nr:MAG: hypothetical protein HRU70_09110 [Phycisphaeraceae bacterium]
MRNVSRRVVSMAAVAGVVVASGVSLGQAGRAPVAEVPYPPTTSKYDEPNLILPMLLMFLIIGAVVGASCIPSKRGHQD